jgi:hypothetical protein
MGLMFSVSLLDINQFCQQFWEGIAAERLLTD